jgi:large subunit ribosomal protein L15
MTISLHTIKPGQGSTRPRKRIGRGNASGTGTYSGKGLKGQNSRSGVSNLKRLGMKQVLLRTPKSRGFKSLKPKNMVVNLRAISAEFKDNELVTRATLLKKGMISEEKAGVKILGLGKLTVKGLKFSGLKYSDSAIEEIKKAGGEII